MAETANEVIAVALFSLVRKPKSMTRKIDLF